MAGKHHRHPTPKATSTRMQEFGMRWFVDISVVNIKSLSGCLYYLNDMTSLCVDDQSRWVRVYALKRKTQVLEALENLRSWVKTQTGREPKIIRTDNEGVFLSDAWREAREKAGMGQECSTPRRSHQNGPAEKYIQTLDEIVTSLLHSSGASLGFWVECLHYAVFVLNRLPCAGNPGSLSPYQRRYEAVPDVGKVRTFWVQGMGSGGWH